MMKKNVKIVEKIGGKIKQNKKYIYIFILFLKLT
jgi:hypothetical protein